MNQCMYINDKLNINKLNVIIGLWVTMIHDGLIERYMISHPCTVRVIL